MNRNALEGTTVFFDLTEIPETKIPCCSCKLNHLFDVYARRQEYIPSVPLCGQFSAKSRIKLKFIHQLEKMNPKKCCYSLIYNPLHCPCSRVRVKLYVWFYYNRNRFSVRSCLFLIFVASHCQRATSTLLSKPETMQWQKWSLQIFFKGIFSKINITNYLPNSLSGQITIT